MEDKRTYLDNQAKEIRKYTLDSIASIGVGHIGGSMSIVEVLSVLYYDVLNIDPKNPKKPDRDRFVLSKGHGGPAVYATLALKGYFPIDRLYTLNISNTKLPSHTDMKLTPGVDMTTGSLGQGFSSSVGMATAAKMDNADFMVYSIIGDGESQEGQVWEAAMFAGNHKIDTLITFTDYNRMQIDGTTEDVNNLEPIKDKWEAFNWHTQVVDGHDVLAIRDAIDNAKKATGKPSMIVLKTCKGKGAYFCEGEVGSHNMPVSKELAEKAKERLI